MRPPAVHSDLQPLYKTWECVGLSVIRPAGAVITLILIGASLGGCSLSRNDNAMAKMVDSDVTGSIAAAPPSGPTPTDSDLAFARNAASDVLTRGDKDSSQPWENPETGARGSVTPLAQAYASEGRHLQGLSWRVTSTVLPKTGCRARPASPTRAGGKFIASSLGGEADTKRGFPRIS